VRARLGFPETVMAVKVLSKKWPEARRDLEAALIDASK
jgi:hypothetical protein